MKRGHGDLHIPPIHGGPWTPIISGILTLICLVMILASIGGCAEFRATRIGISDHGAQAADEVRITSEWSLCNAITVGAWRRAYGQDSIKAQGWRELCSTSIRETP